MRALRTAVALGVVATFVGLPLVAAVGAVGGGGQRQLFLAAGALAVGVVVATVVVGRRHARGGRDGEADDRDDGSRSVWDAIPDWQYTGRHAESGGLARDEQERSLERIREQADEPQRRPEDRE